MMLMPILLAAASLAPPQEPLAGQIRAAIWNDLQLNAMIGNGNWIASLWYNASDGDAGAPDLHILDLTCGRVRKGYRCSFSLVRDGGQRMVMNEIAPDHLDCTASFVRENEADRWMVRHYPPRHSGHSRTDMRCKTVPLAR